MKKAIELADSTFRAYKKKNGATALHLRTYLIVYADADFRAKIRNAQPSVDNPTERYGLSAFFKESPRCWLKLSGKKERECEFFYGVFPETRSIERPAGDVGVTYVYEDIMYEKCVLFFFHVNTIFRDVDVFGKKNILGLSIANMKLVFHINFPGRSPKKNYFPKKGLNSKTRTWLVICLTTRSKNLCSTLWAAGRSCARDEIIPLRSVIIGIRLARNSK
jgi:hypothetical protein